jgi:hypothetical protein
MATLSGIITVTTAGTAVVGPSTGAGTFLVRANPANTGTYMYMGNDGADDVSATTGLPIAKTNVYGVLVTVGPGGLAEYYFDTDNNGDDCFYLKVAGEGVGALPPAA